MKTVVLAAALLLVTSLALAGLNAQCARLCRKEVAACIATLKRLAPNDVRGAKRVCIQRFREICRSRLQQGAQGKEACVLPPDSRPPPLGPPPSGMPQ